jgi:peptide/nickel transport system permease protein
MLSSVRRRTIQSAVSLVGLILLVFFMARLTGDPSVHYLPLDATPEMRLDFAERHGLNDPIYVQFGRYVGDVLRFDFGESMRQQRPALQMVLQAFPTTLLLAALAMSIALVVAILAGSIAARWPNGIVDRVVNLLALTGASAPNFWIAIVGILVFSVWLRILPTSGTGSPLHWVLPVLVLVLRPCGLLAQVVRGSMITALSSGYARTARAKGARMPRVVFIHSLRNIMLPVLTVAGDQAAGIISGAVIVETVFSLPGIGKLMMDSVIYRDFAVLQAAVLVTALFIFLLNVVLDILYAALDPRVASA